MMDLHEPADSQRWIRKGLYVVAAMYTTIGLALSLSAAVAGDRLSTFLGFLIVTGAIAAVGLFTQLLRMEARMNSLVLGVEDVRRNLKAVEAGRVVAAPVADREAHTKAGTEIRRGGLAPLVGDAGFGFTGEKGSVLSDERGLRAGQLHDGELEAMASEPEHVTGDHEAEDAGALLNLAAVGAGEPVTLAAAVLPRDRFPRLVRMLDSEPPARSGPSGVVARRGNSPAMSPPSVRMTGQGSAAEEFSAEPIADDLHSAAGSAESDAGESLREAGSVAVAEVRGAMGTVRELVTVPASALQGEFVAAEESGGDDELAGRHVNGSAAAEEWRDAAAVASVGMTTRNLLREWKLAVREGDLATCRRVFSAIVDLSEPGAAAPLREMLDRLADQTEDRLRRAFSDCVRRQDFAKALVLGRQFAELLPDRPVRGEFERIQQVLEFRANGKEGKVNSAVGQIDS